MIFHWSLSDSKSPQVSRTILRILPVLSNAVVWIVSTRFPTSKSSSPFSNPLVIVPKAHITIYLSITFMFDSIFSSLARSKYLLFFLHSFSFIPWSAGQQSPQFFKVSFFFWHRLGDPFVCQSPIGVYVCPFLGQMLGFAYTLC